MFMTLDLRAKTRDFLVTCKTLTLSHLCPSDPDSEEGTVLQSQQINQDEECYFHPLFMF